MRAALEGQPPPSAAGRRAAIDEAAYDAARIEQEHEDFAYLRRELVNHHYLERAGGRYWVARAAPVRSQVELQEMPRWEAVWLPGFVLPG